MQAEDVGRGFLGEDPRHRAAGERNRQINPPSFAAAAANKKGETLGRVAATLGPRGRR